MLGDVDTTGIQTHHGAPDRVAKDGVVGVVVAQQRPFGQSPLDTVIAQKPVSGDSAETVLQVRLGVLARFANPRARSISRAAQPARPKGDRSTERMRGRLEIRADLRWSERSLEQRGHCLVRAPPLSRAEQVDHLGQRDELNRAFVSVCAGKLGCTSYPGVGGRARSSDPGRTRSRECREHRRIDGDVTELRRQAECRGHEMGHLADVLIGEAGYRAPGEAELLLRPRVALLVPSHYAKLGRTEDRPQNEEPRIEHEPPPGRSDTEETEGFVQLTKQGKPERDLTA